MQGGEKYMKYVGFGRRLVAALLDSVILSALTFLLVAVVIAPVFGKNATVGAGVLYLVNLIIFIGYYTWYQAKMKQTLGKKVMGIKVVNANGNTPSALTFFLRDIVGKMVSGITLGIGYLMVLWDGKKQGLHDKIASTYVVKV